MPNATFCFDQDNAEAKKKKKKKCENIEIAVGLQQYGIFW